MYAVEQYTYSNFLSMLCGFDFSKQNNGRKNIEIELYLKEEPNNDILN